jgi:hypothetical protein
MCRPTVESAGVEIRPAVVVHARECNALAIGREAGVAIIGRGGRQEDGVATVRMDDRQALTGVEDDPPSVP